jgi:outer membrane protein assembly factor BamB
MVQAMHVDDGTLLWSHNVEGSLIYPPVVEKETLYTVTSEGILYALSTSDGALLWHYKYGGPGSFPPPTVVGEVVYIAPKLHVTESSSILALSTKDGALLWQASLARATSFPLVVEDDTIYVAGTNGSCSALHASDGASLWHQQVPGTVWPCSSPAIGHGNVYLGIVEWNHKFISVGSIEHTTRLILYAFNALDGSLRWHYQIGVNPMLSGNLTCPAIANNTVYIASTDGCLYTFQADNGTLLWQHKTNGTLLSQPVVADGIVYVGVNDGYVHALNASDGTLLWQTFTSTAISGGASISIQSQSAQILPLSVQWKHTDESEDQYR